jgi:AcrR family transcriptional regulator
MDTMPKETFFNLPEDKRAHITNIAIDEFANNEYADVSISRIVARAGIAKGSFYQYFNDKEDLHSYLLDLVVKKKWELLSLDQPDPDHMGVFRYMRWTAQAGIEMQLKHPDLVKVAQRAFARNAFPKDFDARTQQEAHKFYLHLIAIGKEQGDIAPEVDNDLAAYIFHAVLFGLGQYLLPRLANHMDYQNDKITFFEVPEIARIFEQTLDILEHGMGRGFSVQKDRAHEEAASAPSSKPEKQEVTQ